MKRGTVRLMQALRHSRLAFGRQDALNSHKYARATGYGKAHRTKLKQFARKELKSYKTGK